jgi:phosphoglycolate phosphatase
LSVPAVKAMIGDGLTALLQRMLPEGTDIDWARSIFAEHYNEQCTKNTPLYPGIAEALQQLADRGWQSALVSNKPSRWCGPILEANAVRHLFSAMRGGDGVRKPAPDPLFDVCAECAVDIQQAVMVGDLSNDILAAQAAGIPSLHVAWGFAPLPEGITATATCSKPSQLVEALGELVPRP